MTDRDIMQQALEALEQWNTPLYKRGNLITALRERLAQPEQELVCVCGAIWEGQELVSTPPQRTWVGLTEEDFSAINQSCLTKLQAATSAESILKDKNNG
jgi:hypothetical protein